MNAGIIVDNDLVNDKRVLREINIIREGGHRVFVLCFGFRGIKYTDPEGISVKRITISRGFKNFLFLLFNTMPLYELLWISGIRKFASSNKIEVLHVHDLYMSKAARKGISSMGYALPVILDLHENFAYTINTYNWTKGLIRRFLSRPQSWGKKEKEYLGYADKYIVLSSDYRDDLVSRYPFLEKNNFCILPNVPDIREMESFKERKAEIPIKKRNPILFYFGIVAERRGIFNALDAFSEVVKRGYKIDFLIIGPADKKDSPALRKFMSMEILKNRIIYIPWISLSDLPAYLDISDICIAPFIKNPQHESGVANKIFDYMLGKKPIIASDCRPQQKIIGENKCGIIYSTRKELETAIIKLLENEDLRAEYGINGYNAVQNQYNTGRVKSSLIEFYSGLK